MLTPEQEAWVNTLSDRVVEIVPYDDRSERLFNEVKQEIVNILGEGVLVEHIGSSSLGISGQDEIDISIGATQEQFDEFILKLETIFGPVQKRYEDRARFEVRREGKKIDLKISDIHHPNYTDSKIFEDHLRVHPEDLERYRLVKESAGGMTTKEYYRAKKEFINEIMEKARV